MLLATAVYGLLLSAWSVVVPLYEGPDERAHVDMVVWRAQGNPWPAYDDLPLTEGVRRDCAFWMVSKWSCLEPGQELTRELVPKQEQDAPPKEHGATFAELDASAGGATLNNNQMTQHPPLYYELMTGVVLVERALASEPWPLAREVALMRLVSAWLVAPLPLVCWWGARRFGLGVIPAIVASLVPFTIPQLAHIASVVENDGLQIILSAVALALVAGVVRGDRSWRTAVVLGVVTGGALLTKSSSFVLPIVITLAYGAAWFTAGDRRAHLPGDLMRLVTVGLLTIALAGWWYIGNLIAHGTFVPSVAADSLANATAPPGFEPRVTDLGRFVVDRLPSRFWGHFGPFAVRQSWHLILASSVATALLAAVAFWRGPSKARARDEGRGWEPPTRWRLGLLLVPGVGLFLMVVIRAWAIYDHSGIFAFVQGRYMFPALVGGTLVVACGLFVAARRWAPAVVLLWGGVMQVDGVRAVLQDYWAGAGLAGQVRTMAAWSRWPYDLLKAGAVVGVLATLALVAAVAVTVSVARRRPQHRARARGRRPVSRVEADRP